MNVDGVAALAKQENVYKVTYKRAYISLCLYATSDRGGGVTYLNTTLREQKCPFIPKGQKCIANSIAY